MQKPIHQSISDASYGVIDRQFFTDRPHAVDSLARSRFNHTTRPVTLKTMHTVYLKHRPNTAFIVLFRYFSVMIRGSMQTIELALPVSKSNCVARRGD